MPSKCFQWSTLSHYSPIEQHQVPSPQNNHHHNKNECVGSTSTALETYVVALQMDNNTIAHTKSLKHYTTLKMGFLLLLLLLFLDVSEGKLLRRVFLLYANLIKRRVYWKHPQESWWIPAAVPSQSSFWANTCFVIWVCHHIDIH